MLRVSFITWFFLMLAGLKAQPNETSLTKSDKKAILRQLQKSYKNATANNRSIPAGSFVLRVTVGNSTNSEVIFASKDSLEKIANTMSSDLNTRVIKVNNEIKQFIVPFLLCTSCLKKGKLSSLCEDYDRSLNKFLQNQKLNPSSATILLYTTNVCIYGRK
jgi:hypothetical protein